MEKTRKSLYSVVAVCNEEGKDEVICRDDAVFAIDNHDAQQIFTIQQAEKLSPFVGRMMIYSRPF